MIDQGSFGNTVQTSGASEGADTGVQQQRQSNQTSTPNVIRDCNQLRKYIDERQAELTRLYEEAEKRIGSRLVKLMQRRVKDPFHRKNYVANNDVDNNTMSTAKGAESSALSEPPAVVSDVPTENDTSMRNENEGEEEEEILGGVHLKSCVSVLGSGAVVGANGKAPSKGRPSGLEAENRIAADLDSGSVGAVGISADDGRKRKSSFENRDAVERRKNKRMFGVLLGTLKQFQTSENETSRSDLRKRRKSIEERITAKESSLEEETQALYEKLYGEQTVLLQDIDNSVLKLEQQELELARGEASEYEEKCLLTVAEPRIYYAPLKHNTKTRRLLEEQRAKRNR
eukprot:Nk52_evm21s1569 gene=Nk52_evmTU21s1569